MFAHFELPDIGDVSRRTVAASLIVGVAALVALFSFGYLWVGVGACIGLALGIVNYRLVGVSVDKVAATGTDNPKRPLAANTMSRLAVVTVIALGLAYVDKGLGFGVLGGLAVFQILLIANVARSMAKAGPGPEHEELLDGPIIDSNVVVGHVLDGPIIDSNEPVGSPAAAAADVGDDARGGV
ncbi:MAG: hypothetical protein ABSB09_16115 [Acidimicrobiales bacterium]